MIYLNNSATSFPKPKSVVARIQEFISQPPIYTSRQGADSYSLIDDCRKNVADFLNIKNFKNIIFTSGATESLNIAIFGLNLENKHVITSVTEHNSVIRPLKQLEKDKNTELTFIDCDKNGFVNPNDFEQAIKNNTKAIVINHCSNVTGSVQDINKIIQIAKQHNIISIIDASQSIGNVEIDLQTIDADIFAFTAHKSLFGMPGTGVLYLKDDIKLKPLKVGGTGVKSNLLYQPDYRPVLYESGTPNYLGIFALNQGIEFINNTGLQKMIDHKKELFLLLFNELKSINELEIYSDSIDSKNAVISFNIKNFVSSEISYILQNSFDIIVRSGLHCAPLIHNYLGGYQNGTIRISLSYFNTENDIKIFIKSLKEIILMMK